MLNVEVPVVIVSKMDFVYMKTNYITFNSASFLNSRSYYA